MNLEKPIAKRVKQLAAAGRRLRGVVIATIGLLALSACANHPPLNQTDLVVDGDRFQGDWYVIANIPYFMEKNKIGTRTSYNKIGPDLYEDIFAWHEGDFDSELQQWVGTARSLNEANTEWQSVFFWVLRSQFSILDMSEDYQTMSIGVDSRNLGWVFSREKTISDEDYARAMRTFEANGYDISRFSKVPQLPEQIGAEGFQPIEE